MKKVISMFLATVMCLVVSVPAFATDTRDEPVKLTMEQAVEILGISMEDVEGLELHRIPSVGTEAGGFEDSSLPSEMPPGVYYEEISLGNFTGAIHRIKGPRFKWSFTLGETNGAPGTVYVGMFFTTGRQGEKYQEDFEYASSYESITFKNTYNADIYFKYGLAGTGSLPSPSGKGLMVVVVYETA